MSGEAIAAEVAAALLEVATEVGDGEFLVTLTRDSGEPVNPWDTDTSTSEDFDIPAMVSNYTRDQIDGTLILATDRRVMLAGTIERPTTADKLTIGGIVHSIVSVTELAPSGVALYYEVQARK